jgi:serine O-acetyltransferase
VDAARRAHPFPPHLRERAEVIVRQSLRLLFPHFGAVGACTPDSVREELDALSRLVREAIASVLDECAGRRDHVGVHGGAAGGTRCAHASTPRRWRAVIRRPRGVDEVILAYPGFLAVAVHRLSHVLYGAACRCCRA